MPGLKPWHGWKAGRCPSPLTLHDPPCRRHPSKLYCWDDSGCPRQLKCCPDGCGKLCVQPIDIDLILSPGPPPTVPSPPLTAAPPTTTSSPPPTASPSPPPTSPSPLPTSPPSPPATQSPSPPKYGTKPGLCPQMMAAQACSNISLSLDDCQGHDFFCPRTMKCCPSSCGTRCEWPILQTTPAPPPTPPTDTNRRQKPGLCRLRLRNYQCLPGGRWRVGCNGDDYRCPGRQKCCRGSCGFFCQQPVKPGFCPVLRAACGCTLSPTGGCTSGPNTCRSDDTNCPGAQKCCEGPGYGCGHECTKPAPCQMNATRLSYSNRVLCETGGEPVIRRG